MSKVAVISLTMAGDQKLPLMQKSFRALWAMAGTRIEHYVGDNGCSPAAKEWLQEMEQEGKIGLYEDFGQNMGISIGMNILLDLIDEAGPYSHVLKYDPDCLPRTPRFVHKLKAVSTACKKAGGFALVGPRVDKLHNPIPTLTEMDGDLLGLPKYKLQAVRILGGICCLMPWQFFDQPDGSRWRHNPWLAKGAGQDEEVAGRVDDIHKLGLGWGMIRAANVIVEHAYSEKGQIERFPDEHGTMKWKMNRLVGWGL